MLHMLLKPAAGVILSHLCGADQENLKEMLRWSCISKACLQQQAIQKPVRRLEMPDILLQPFNLPIFFQV